MNRFSHAEELAERLNKSKMGSREVEALFGVSQATVSRLRRGKISRVAPYVMLLDRHDASRRSDQSMDDCIQLLRARADDDPALRILLIQLSNIMRNA